MKLEVIATCDYVQINRGNNLNIMNAFSLLECPKLPLVKTYNLVVRFRCSKEESGSKQVYFKILSPSGRLAFDEICASATIDEAKFEDEYVVFNLNITFNNYQFTEFGTYHFEVKTDGQVYELPLTIKQVK